MAGNSNAGRKPLPDNVKILKGTFREDRKKELPEISEAPPTPPSWLNKRAKQIFTHIVNNRLKDMSLASQTHTEMIALLARREEEVERFSKFLDENGDTYTKVTKFGEEIKARPEVQMKADAIKHVHQLLSEFGLSPSSINKLGKKPKDKDVPNSFSGF